jgi:hypothetical protein
MKQQGIGTVVRTTTGDVLKKLKEAGPDQERRRKVAAGRDTVSISPEAREMMGAEEEHDDEAASETEAAE